MPKFLYIIVSVLSSTICLHAGTTQHDKLLENILDVYKDSVTLKNYGIAVYLKHNNEIAKYAVGVADDGIAMTADKVFNIASLTKTFTAVLVLQEVEKCNLKLNDTIGKWFKGNKNVSGSISIEQLLRQTSGLSEVVDVTYAETVFMNPDNKYNHSYLYNKIGEAIAKPGEFYKYRNTNYILLGYILEKLNQKPYGTLVKLKTSLKLIAFSQIAINI